MKEISALSECLLLGALRVLLWRDLSHSDITCKRVTDDPRKEM